MKRMLLALCAAMSLAAFAAEETVNEQDPTLLFEKRYNFGATAVLDRNWVDAQRHFEAALAALGQRDHIKKQVAQILAKKAQDESKKQRALFTANELLRLNQFKEAEEAFLAAKADLGDTEEIRQGLDAVRTRREQEPKLRAMMEREKEYQLALREAYDQTDMQKFEQARMYAERARTLKPEDPRAMELMKKIEVRLKREALDREHPPVFKEKVPREKPVEKAPGDF